MSIIYSEIKGQYAALMETKAYIDARFAEIEAQCEGSGTIVFIGSGSSYAVAKSAAMMAQLRLSRPAMAIPAGDLLLHLDAYRSVLTDCTVFVLSRSGETSEAILAARSLAAAETPPRIIGLSCMEASTLSGLCDLALEMPWAFDHSVCQTRTVSCLYFACAYWAALLAKDGALAASLVRAVEQGPAFMARHEETLKSVAELPWSKGVVLGDAELSGLCDEGALAFKEICQLSSNYYHLLDVRHGPMVLIDDGTLVIAVLSGNGAGLEESLVRDLLAKGATVVTYSDMPTDIPGAINIASGMEFAHPARGIPAILICQLITYYKSFLTGANPDQPDGLSAWIELS